MVEGAWEFDLKTEDSYAVDAHSLLQTADTTHDPDADSTQETTDESFEDTVTFAASPEASEEALEGSDHNAEGN